jgi:hypothetical protein
MMKSPNVFLGGLLGGLTAMISVARAAEPEAAPVGGSAPVVAAQPALITVEEAPGADLPAHIAADVRAAVDDVLAGRAAAGAPIDITLETGGAVVRVGSLWRRIPIAGWDYAAVRTVALHVLDLLQPAPEVPEVASTNRWAGPPTILVAPGNRRETEPAPESPSPFSFHFGVAGARGAELPDPWLVGFTGGAAWTREWLRIAVEVGWDHAAVRHPDGITVNYDAVPLRLVLAAKNEKVMAGVRAGFAEYRVTGEQAFRVVTPLVGPFVAAPVPIAGRFRGLLIAGFDYFARRTQLTKGGFDTTYSTPQVAPYVGVIVEADLRP